MSSKIFFVATLCLIATVGFTSSTPDPMVLSPQYTLQAEFAGVSGVSSVALSPNFEDSFFIGCDDKSIPNHMACDKNNNCDVGDATGEIDFLYFEAKDNSNYVTINFTLNDNDNTAVNMDKTAIFLKECPNTLISNNSLSQYPNNIATIGLGVDGDFFQQIFANTTNKFSLFFPKKGEYAKLAYDYDSSYDAENGNVTVQGNDLVSENWEVSFSDITVNGKALGIEGSKVLFDPNVNYIGLYYKGGYDLIINALNETKLNCVGNIFANCTNSTGSAID
mmetsp:Transcript_14444/g.12254  ORF Transcript_14444/g.12254 Transcript_14444/m.12254 type:complete len:278 (+) Transcript_14444:57-890(+)|eukprot:CAMPEP_0114587294 /NCGR_PEP_ID=MMETSP0125-20121206/10290_1 /TAXON_ID=485358 ORGANISM="Aristerostoma sp., Strain ATCC 50986" /NCGR_SAMPLE_ID=MMETSP0125 /ASSEMBLY_ACC=CAM_ASM_000245 /LENGTH=277 /DNA_ID=CAMNT_0001783133 /DNA_START=45 /DNA_END=878 /DNA_ORIENTATION=-